MKKLATLLLVFTMVVGLGAFVYADDVTCDLSEEDQAYMLEVKSKFLGEKVADGTITQAQADEMFKALEEQTGNATLRGLGFGLWLRDSEYAEKALEIMPHKNGFGDGVRKLDGTGRRGRGRGNH